MADYPDFEGNKQNVYSAGGWSAIQDKIKHISGTGANKTWGQAATVTYNVPAGKVYYAVMVSVAVRANAQADGDLLNNFLAELYCPNIITLNYRSGGVNGLNIALDPPAKADAGELVYANLEAYTNHAVNMNIVVRGYELDA